MQSFQNRTVLVTGGSGFLGYNIVKALRYRYDVHFTYRQNRITIPHAFSHKLDIRSENEIAHIFEIARPGMVIHCAAMTSTEACEGNWDEAYRTNVQPTYHLIQRCRAFRARLVVFSTDMIFDGERGNYEETDTPFPKNRYGRSKLMAEEMVGQAQSKANVILRPGLIYGWGTQQHGGFIRWMRDSLESGKPVTLYEDEFRTPIYVEDLVDVVKEVLKGDYKGTFHVAGRERISRYEFGLRFARHFGYDESLIQKAGIREHPGQVERPQDVSLNIAKARKHFSTVLAGVDDGLDRLKEEKPEDEDHRLGGLGAL